MAELHFGSKEYFEKQSEFWFKENSKHISERDAYKKQRDELINDMAEVKRKAEILDKLEEMFETSANANRKHSFNGGAEFYERYLDIIRERGSDVEV
ncbi:hypothetical protein H8Z65_14180 [Mycobacterium avium subsp. hominissuis]|uniref:hypothetical protein n=1 Tax=Mycobacterium avium TaxID=1764 RepID=UPI001CE23139|nr:hypothetical protein [Mycobacterium avium]MCA4764692.1 hypothetical protein [Mycobacterium avium subsp. hominissuis]